MKELFNSLCSGLAPEKGGTPLLWAATNLLSLICYKSFTYFPFFYFLRLWQPEGEGRVERTYRFDLFLGNKTKKHTVTLFSNVSLWDFVVTSSRRRVHGCASQKNLG